MKELVFAVEAYLPAVEELRVLHAELWAEKARDHDAIPLDMNYQAYEDFAVLGALHLVTARHDGKLVGYHLSVIHPHLHYKTILTCYTDLFYLRKDFRTGLTGYKMLKFFRDSVKERGAKLVYMGHSLTTDLGAVLGRLGFEPIECAYKLMNNDHA